MEELVVDGRITQSAYFQKIRYDCRDWINPEGADIKRRSKFGKLTNEIKEPGVGGYKRRKIYIKKRIK